LIDAVMHKLDKNTDFRVELEKIKKISLKSFLSSLTTQFDEIND
jgi:uncharacterized protein YlaN (UPF0358 family)